MRNCSSDDSGVGARAVRERWEADQLEMLHSRINHNEPMCLAYHIKARCNAACGRAYDHVAYTAAQYAPLVQFCTEHWPQV